MTGLSGVQALDPLSVAPAAVPIIAALLVLLLDAVAPPRQGGRWPGPWHRGEVFLYGRRRKVRYKEAPP